MRPAPPALARLLGVLVAAVLAAAGLVVATTGTATARADDPMTGAPAVGDCYDLTLEQAVKESTSEAPVDCAKRHTLLVGAVGQIAASVDWDDARALDAASSKICDPFWRAYVDIESPRHYLSLHTRIWLQPTEAQIDAGARWISCEIGLRDDTKLLPLPKGGGPAKGGKKMADSVARCVASGKSYRTVPCSQRHGWRATYAFAVKAKGSEKAVYAAVQKAAGKRCPAKMKSDHWLWTSRNLPRKNTYAVICLDETRK